MNNDFNYCPKCGGKNVKCIGNRKWVCPDCGFDLYHNVAAAVGIMIYDNEDNVLFELRAREPKLGFADLPGGFVDYEETAEDAVARECKEEMSIDVTDFHYLCTYPNVYPYKNIEYHTCDLFFTAKLPEKYHNIDEYIQALKAEEDEIAGFCSYRVHTKEDIEKIPFAFASGKKALARFVEWRSLERSNSK